VRVLVAGAYGFIGRHVVAALRARGHTVVAAVRASRRGTRLPGIETIDCDFVRDVDPAVWRARLGGVDAVVNCAGILRERRAGDFERVHDGVPVALGRAALACRVARFVQVSVLGDPADGAFVASKHGGDARLLALDLSVTVLRPSLVYSLAGSYGGSSLLRALAAVPWVLPLPGDGRQPVQPIHVEDLAAIVVAALERPQPARGTFEIGGPSPMTLREFLQGLRAWLGVAPGLALPVPERLMDLGAALGEWFGSGPLGRTMWRMTRRGNALSPHAMQDQRQTFGIAGRSLQDAIAVTPCHTQDRWHARLYPLAAVLRAALAAVCLVSAVAGFSLSPDALRALAAPLGLPDGLVSALGYGGSGADLLLGAALLVPRTARPAAWALLVLTAGYTVALGVLLPSLWLDPFGGLVKNLVLLPAIGAYLVLSDMR
jgi:uncharacterized protein YbjT (DUF2867 family)